MTYEMYKIIRNKEEFFNNWKSKEYNDLPEKLKDRIYDNYVKKANVFNRDSFKCQNIECITPNNPLTIHHIKHKRKFKKPYQNPNKVRNMITICDECHKKFNKGKISLVYSNEENVPAHMRGLTQTLDLPKKSFNYKVLRKEMKIFRKQLKMKGLVYSELNWKTIYLLMTWLSIPYDEIVDEIDN